MNKNIKIYHALYGLPKKELRKHYKEIHSLLDLNEPKEEEMSDFLKKLSDIQYDKTGNIVKRLHSIEETFSMVINEKFLEGKI